MEIHIFGKNNCAYCVSTKSKVAHFLKKWELEEKVAVVYHDMESVDGRAEGCFYDVQDVPTTIVLDEGSDELGRWVKSVPPVEELRAALGENAVDCSG
ncbi:MAG TPA: hypothetical protein PL033_15330 [Candidatus Brocadiia bacterium]|nr:hypothetical protein [Candidatus Brocadiia bacterium]